MLELRSKKVKHKGRLALKKSKKMFIPLLFIINVDAHVFLAVIVYIFLVITGFVGGGLSRSGRRGR